MAKKNVIRVEFTVTCDERHVRRIVEGMRGVKGFPGNMMKPLLQFKALLDECQDATVSVSAIDSR